MWEELQAFRCQGARPRAKTKVKARVKAKPKVSKRIWQRKWRLWNERTKSSNSIKMSTENITKRSWRAGSFRKDVMMSSWVPCRDLTSRRLARSKRFNKNLNIFQMSSMITARNYQSPGLNLWYQIQHPKAWLKQIPSANRNLSINTSITLQRISIPTPTDFPVILSTFPRTSATTLKSEHRKIRHHLTGPLTKTTMEQPVKGAVFRPT